jgi:TorA maturation chaperone TorD
MDDVKPSLNPSRSALVDDEIESARAREYSLLAVLLAKAPDSDLLGRLALLQADDTRLGSAHAAMAEAAAIACQKRVEHEFFDLFIGVGRGELLPYGSYYLSRALSGRPLARLRADLARLGIARVQAGEPEDHAAMLCAIMASLIDGRFATPVGADRDMFESHLAPWLGRFFADLEHAQAAQFYRYVGTVGRCFVSIESEAFRLAEQGARENETPHAD